eukprot:2564903-Amphidinium_carterae.1
MMLSDIVVKFVTVPITDQVNVKAQTDSNKCAIGKVQNKSKTTTCTECIRNAQPVDLHRSVFCNDLKSATEGSNGPH